VPPQQSSTKISKQSHETANNKIADTKAPRVSKASDTAAAKQTKHDQKKQNKEHAKKLEDERLALTIKARLNNQQDTAKRAISYNPLDRPTTEAEWIKAQALDSKMMRRLRKEVIEDSKSKISLNKVGLMVYVDPNKSVARIVVPEHLQAIVCYMHHNMDLTAHQGAKRAIAAIARCYYWPGIPTFVRNYVKSCSFCTRRKASRKENAGMSIA